MKVASLPVDEGQRIESLLRYEILDTGSEQSYDDLVKLAALLCETPIALVSLVDVDRQWFKARVGLAACETHRDFAFCSHAIHGHDVFVVEDTSKDERFFDNPLVIDDPAIRFYAGAPLITRDGYALGTLCVIDRKPRKLTFVQMQALGALSRQVVMQLELRLNAIKLRQINESKNKFLTLVSHDLKKPFNAILGFSSALEQRIDHMSQKEIVSASRRIFSSAKTAYDLLTNLLVWSRFELGAIEFRPRLIEMADVADHVFRMLKTQADEKHITLSYTGDMALSVFADWKMLCSILQNLIDNAIKFSYSGSTIEVNARVSGDHALIHVSDHGVGMDTEELKKLFNIACYHTTEGTDGEKGTGLGILLCKDFIERHKGRIWVESDVNKGTTFSFELPNQRLQTVH